MDGKTHSWPHPVSLLFGSCVLSGCLIFATKFISLSILIILFLAIAVGIRAGLLSIGLRILKLWPFLVATFAIHAALSSHPSAGFGLLPRIDLNTTGLVAAGFFAVRLAVILAVGMALFQAYSPQEYSRGLTRVAAKLPFWRSRAAQLELTIGLALQFVPFVEQEYRRLNLALAARGEPVGGTLLRKLTRQRKLLFPLLLNGFRRADQVSLALQARGYAPRTVRTSLNSIAVSATEVVMVLAFSILCVAAIWLR